MASMAARIRKRNRSSAVPFVPEHVRGEYLVVMLGSLQNKGGRGMQRWLWGYVGIVLFVGAVTVAQNVWCLSKTDWAAWVQAIGSIAAIIAAYLLASRQQRMADHDAKRERTRARYRAACYAIAILEEAMIAIGDFSMQIDLQRGVGPRIFELTRLEGSLAVLMTALHQPLPSEVLNEVFVGLRAVQTQTRLAQKAGGTTLANLKTLTNTHSEWLNAAHAKVKSSREKWRFALNEASLEE